MTLGEQFKKLRAEKGLSQPELAEITGIEQSYLSKLENDKSLPSNDIFRKLLSAFELTVTQLLAPLEPSYVRKHLLVISDIEQQYRQSNARQTAKQRNMLYGASLLIVVAVALFYTGFNKQLFNETRYEYLSKGVVLAGEPMNIFWQWKSLLASDSAGSRETKIRQQAVVMAQRSDKMIILTPENRAGSFEMQVNGGRRLFSYASYEQVPRLVNAWLQIIAVFLFSCGIMGFVLERRLFKIP